MLKEFSLDNKEGALARLVGELSTNHGDLTKDLQTRIDVVMKEFSLNEENSALSRLVQNVDRAQRTITSEFSLDNETSALSRLKRELLELLAATEKKNQAFQEEVKVSLARIVTTRQEIEQSRGTASCSRRRCSNSSPASPNTRATSPRRPATRPG